MNQIEIKYHKTEYGELILGSYEEQLVLCDWRFRKMREAVDNRIQKGLNAEYIESNSNVIDLTIRQLDEYFAGSRKAFEIPLLMVGTDFQQSVWNALIQIPYGQTDTYLSLSRRLGNELAIRAVASANGANAISIIVPCHRIIGSDGDLIGYAGGLPAKEKLLNLENPKLSQIKNSQMAFDFG
jgi:methylated-DNA-[protein]-cysteine S-methyltransferase